MQLAKRCSVGRLLFEAYCRNATADEHERAKPLDARWLGLGTASAYHNGIKAGLFVFHNGRTPPARCKGWLCLTTQGVQELHARDAEFRAAFARTHPYRRA